MTGEFDAVSRATPRSALMLAGVPGILSLCLMLPEVPGVPTTALLLQPTLLLVVAALAGSRLAVRADLRLADSVSLARRAGQVTAGALFGLVMAAADHGLRGLWQAAESHPPSVIEAWSASGLVVGLLYGAVVEEVMFRWFAMSLLLVALAWLVADRTARPPHWIMPAAAIGAAALFAASHLPALALAGSPPAAGAVLRTLLLNGMAGAVFGLFFAQRDLVAAMLAHAGLHLGFAAAALAAEAWP
ncbi:CPBP family glutamic-type intramembrane protease [Falsiroseomonas oryziterrae]|uniref:CPBP family glutamic-type intramembrane protease n=1 Tax=Falsiroseomonas oryziterrae TaxID=2911368 RepID=UPI001F016714|nr:CPBP family glutamic-type intramembrane protease [Roseomonas sp. NPKOSM-4]